MLKDLIFTVALLCICFMLLIMLNELALTTETNILLSSVFIGWTLLQFVRRRMFLYQRKPDDGNTYAVRQI